MTGETEWDPHQRAAVDAFMDLEADTHVCGQPLSESAGPNPPKYVVGELTCQACQTLQAYIDKHHKKGVPPHVILRVYTAAEAETIAAGQRR